jgi:hypothetical protein
MILISALLSWIFIVLSLTEAKVRAIRFRLNAKNVDGVMVIEITSVAVIVS